MKSIILLAGILALLAFSPQIKYPLPDARLKPKDICGQPRCTPGSFGILLNFTQNPYSPTIAEGDTPKDIAYQVVGHAIRSGDVSGSLILTCNASVSNPFSKDDIQNTAFYPGKKIEYSRKEKLNLDVQASVESNIDELKSLNIPSEKIAKVEAKIRAAYNRVNGKELNIKGLYTEWSLTSNAINSIEKNSGFKECREYMIKQNMRLITAVGLIYFNIEFETNSLDSVSTEIDSALKQEGINASLSVSFKREVSKSLKSVTPNVYQIIVWRHAGIKNGKFIQGY